MECLLQPRVKPNSARVIILQYETHLAAADVHSPHMHIFLFHLAAERDWGACCYRHCWRGNDNDGNVGRVIYTCKRHLLIQTPLFLSSSLSLSLILR